jgi:hypothetical protein
VKATGKVTKLEWTNPHAWVFVNVEEVCEGPANSERDKNWKCRKTGTLKATNEWAFELASPNGLMRQGWSRNSLKAGDVITVEGTRAKDGTSKGNGRAVALANGQRLFAGSSQGVTP